MRAIQFTKPVAWYQGWANDKERTASSSGGVVSAVCRSFLYRGGWINGCVFDGNEFTLVLTNIEEKINLFKGSKYVKSNPRQIYKEVIAKLFEGKEVLFIGVPCQVAALRSIVDQKDLGKLYTIDFICHGTPSQNIFKRYLHENKVHVNQYSKIQFRNKNDYALRINGETIHPSGVMDRYLMAFLNSVSYVDSCYECKYAGIERCSDITVGDSWGSGITQVEQQKGISLIICNTEKGINLLRSTNGLHLFPADPEIAIQHNKQLSSPSFKPKERNTFFAKIKNGDSINKTVFSLYKKQCFEEEVIGAVKLYIKRMIHKLA